MKTIAERVGNCWEVLDQNRQLICRAYDFEKAGMICDALNKVYSNSEDIDGQDSTKTDITGLTPNDLLVDFYAGWIETYKLGAVREVTCQKYKMALNWIRRIAPNLKLKDIDRLSYQKIINAYAETHERQTVMDFHHQLKTAILDAVDEHLIDRDPTRKVVIKGKPPKKKKLKYLSKFELHLLLDDLDLEFHEGKMNYDWLIFLVAKTGLRLSEALGLTPDDFKFTKQSLSVNKTWDYKNNQGFVPTKNKSSVRTVEMDWQTVALFSEYTKHFEHDQPIFVPENKIVCNSTINSTLHRHCKKCNIPIINIHGLRHTHASLLLCDGVSVASVAKRLGHSNITTTQKVYIHVIKELESKDINLVMGSLSSLS